MEDAFNFRKYRFARLGPKRSLDLIHIQALHMLAPICQGTAVEIGCWRGASTSALVEAMNKGWLDTLHLFEIRPTPCLQKVISMATKGSVHLHTGPTWDFTPDQPFTPSLVFIDGNHQFGALADALWALSFNPKVIVMHDCSSWPRLKDCWGAHRASKILERVPGRITYKDDRDRQNALTWRGLSISYQEGVDVTRVIDYLDSQP